MEYGICQRLTQRRLNLQFAALFISALRNEAHELIYEWRDERDLTRERLSQLDKRNRPRSLRRKRKSLFVDHVFELPLGIPINRIRGQRLALNGYSSKAG
jgi:hypothetical protein